MDYTPKKKSHPYDRTTLHQFEFVAKSLCHISVSPPDFLLGIPLESSGPEQLFFLQCTSGSDYTNPAIISLHVLVGYAIQFRQRSAALALRSGV
jgi:hypothetical protein